MEANGPTGRSPTDEEPLTLVTRHLPDPVAAELRRGGRVWTSETDRQLEPAELREAIDANAPDALLVMATDRIDAELIGSLPPSVRLIGTLSVGHNHIDLEAARERGIAVVHTPDILSDAVAEMAILVLLGAARRAHEGAQLIYGKRWTGWSPTQLLGRDMTGARLGIYGMGRIGRTIARRAGAAFDMEVHYHNRSRLAPDLENGAVYHADPADLLGRSDFLVLAAPSTPETKGFLRAETLAQLPKGAIVANIARGDLVDDEALIAALRSGHLGAAGLDVFNGEPALHPGYLELPNVFLQPHQGSSTIGTRVRMGRLLVDSMRAVRDGKDVPNRLA